MRVPSLHSAASGRGKALEQIHCFSSSPVFLIKLQPAKDSQAMAHMCKEAAVLPLFQWMESISRAARRISDPFVQQ